MSQSEQGQNLIMITHLEKLKTQHLSLIIHEQHTSLNATTLQRFSPSVTLKEHFTTIVTTHVRQCKKKLEMSVKNV